MKNIFKNHPIFTFLLFTFLLSSIFYLLIIHTGKLGSGFGLYVVALMWCPGLSALITSWLLDRPLANLGWQWGKTKYQLWSYLIPMTYAFIAYVIIWSVGWGGFYNDEFVANISSSFGWSQLPNELVIVLYFIIMGIFGMATNAASALGRRNRLERIFGAVTFKTI